MTKIIRKYNRILLATFGVFLLVTWLFTGSQSIFHTDPTQQVEFTLGKEKVRVKDMVHAAAEHEGLKALIPSLVARLGVQDATHWYLLTREAQAQGLVGNAQDGEDWIPELAESMVPIVVEQQILEQYRSSPGTLRMLRQNRQLLSMLAQQQLRDPAQVAEMKKQLEENLQAMIPHAAASARLQKEELELALAKFRGIVRMFNGYTGAARMSDKRVVSHARDRFDKVHATVVSVPASVMVDPAQAPSELEMQMHFEKYKAAEPQSGEYGFGYTQPKRVKLEWMKLDRGAVQGAVTIDPVEANKYWQQHRATYAGEFAAEKDKVVSELTGLKVQEIFAEAERAYKARLRTETRRLGSEGSLKQLPADWKPPAMESLAQGIVDAIKTSQKITLPMPVVERKTDWVRIPEASRMGGIGESTLVLGSRELTFPELLVNTAEFGSKVDIGLQTNVPFESGLSDAVGNRYFITVLATKGEGPAEDLSEVRAQVAHDVQVLAAYRALEVRVPDLQAQAIKDGMEALGKSLAAQAVDKTRSLSPFFDQSFTMATSPQIANDDPSGTLRKAVFAQAHVMGLLTAATPENAASRTVAIGIPQTQTVVIAQVTGIETQTTESLRTIRPALTENFISDELFAAGGDMPYTLESLKKRLEFTDVSPKKNAKQDGATVAPEKPAEKKADQPASGK